MRRTSGFTLVEMVVSLTILSLLTLATLTALRTLADTQTRLESTVSRLEEMRLVGRFLRDSLRQAQPVLKPKSFSAYFEGDPQSLSWVAPLQGVEGVAGMQFMRVFRDGDTLQVQFQPYRAVDPVWTGVDSHTLIEDLQTFEVAYRSEQNGPWTPQWLTDPGVPATLPQAVKLRIQAQGRYWPDLVVAPDLIKVGS